MTVNTDSAYAKQITRVSTQLNGNSLTFEYGRFAEQATASVFATLGGTQVLSIVTMGAEREDLDYFPLSLEYQERLYAGGKIKGSRWIKREGRPSDEAVLAGRLIDRSARPLFPKGLKKDVQIVNLVLSVDGENDPVLLAANATFAALAISPIPWAGPIAAVRVGLKDDKLLVYPHNEQRDTSELDLVVSSSADRVVMIEAGGKQVPEERMLEAIKMAHEGSQAILGLINELVEKVGQTKLEFKPKELNPEVKAEVDRMVNDYLKQQKDAGTAPDHSDIQPVIKDQLKDKYDIKEVLAAFEESWKKAVRKIMMSGTRPDGRKVDELRPLGADVGLLTRTHGSGIFKRGSTQVLSITALGTPAFSQIIESAESEEVKRFIHYYSMPPYATGETGRIGAGRREIGHGALAEKALDPVIPSLEAFPYTIMVVSEVMSSNGSTSMGSVCGTTLSLMDAGVPITDPVSGISMGLIEDAPDGPMVLTDIAGIEDFNGDMDFKVAGTEKGITAIQLDVKNKGLSLDLMREVIEKARAARMKILEVMLTAIPLPRVAVSAYAPKVKQVQIPTDKIGDVIGPGGRMIRQIVADTGAEVNVEDDGKVTISAVDQAAVDKAVEWIKGLTSDPEIGKIYKGIVKRIVPFGAFVEILPGREGLVHVSRMAQGFVDNPEAVVHMDQEVDVKVFEIDELGRVNLTMILDDNAPQGGDNSQPGGNMSGGGYGDRERRGRSDSRGGGRDHRPRRDFR